jgi:hypothetical protein
MSGCRILDDKELEEQAIKLNRADMRLWLPDTFGVGETRIFKPFPKAFQAKTYNEEFPPLSTIQTARPVYKAPNTMSLLERVRGILSTPTVLDKRGGMTRFHEPTTPPYGDIKTSEQGQDSAQE